LSEQVLFCIGCNQRPDSLRHGDVCIHCGQKLTAISDVSTVELRLAPAPNENCRGGRRSVEADRALVGQRLASYEVEEFVGRGGMARVYRARHTMLRRPCALKVLNPHLVAGDPQYLELFLEEACAAASLVHPNVVTVHNIGVAADLHFIEMEFVPGLSLQSVLNQDGRLPALRATEHMVQATAALAEAHRHGIVHHDVKPANVLLAANGVAKLADFGLAKRVVADRSQAAAPQSAAASVSGPAGTGTSSGCGRDAVIAGTPYYMAPELFGGAPATKPSDVYAAGVTYYYLITGALPFSEPSMDALATQHGFGAIPDARDVQPEVPERAVQIIGRCLRKDPSERYADADALHLDLRSVYGRLRDVESLLREALVGVRATWRPEKGRFEVTVHLPDGRKQRVFVESGEAKLLSDEVVRLYSVCAPRREGYYHRALELNAEVPHASIAVQNVGGSPHFVMVATYPRATCDPEEVRASILNIARWADAVERILTGADIN
jgi:serine/threonine-protein kinase